MHAALPPAPTGLPPMAAPRAACGMKGSWRRWALGLTFGMAALLSHSPAVMAQAGAGGNSPEALEAQARALQAAAASIVGVRSLATEDARSNATLGRQRIGSGAVISPDGLVLTIGYLILESEKVDLLLPGGRSYPARVVAYDLATGFGLLEPLVPLRLPALRLGDASGLDLEEPHVIASAGDEVQWSIAQVVSRRPFSGYWEYHIDSALFTVPPRSDHPGAALLNRRGELLGIGSLVVMEAQGPGRRVPGNMFVPVDLLKPVLTEMRERGASASSTRAWLGVNCVEQQGLVRVTRVTADSPAAIAGVKAGDVILKLDGLPISNLEGFYRKLWEGPQPEREVTLEVGRGPQVETLKAYTVDRNKTLRRSKGI